MTFGKEENTDLFHNNGTINKEQAPFIDEYFALRFGDIEVENWNADIRDERIYHAWYDAGWIGDKKLEDLLSGMFAAIEINHNDNIYKIEVFLAYDLDESLAYQLRVLWSEGREVCSLAEELEECGDDFKPTPGGHLDFAGALFNTLVEDELFVAVLDELLELAMLRREFRKKQTLLKKLEAEILKRGDE